MSAMVAIVLSIFNQCLLGYIFPCEQKNILIQFVKIGAFLSYMTVFK